MFELMEPKFSVDQKVVYPSQGVGKITEIFEKTFKENTMLYYKIYIEASDMIVMVPVEKADDLGIRQIVTAEEAQEALNLLSEDFEPITSDWKLRYQMNLDLLKKGTVKDIATIVRCLYNRSKVKELPILERKLYDSAKKLLEDEISLALGKSEKEISDEIHTKLEPPGSTPKIKHAVILDDDEDDDLMNDLDGSSKGKDSDDDEDDGDDSKSSDSMDSDEDFDDDDSDFE
jgi:CarD family transcriptional regulator